MRSTDSLLEKTDTVIMACKPYQIEGVLETYREALKNKALISIAAGWDYAKYRPLLSDSTRGAVHHAEYARHGGRGRAAV